MTRINFDLKEKVLLYAFGADTKEGAIANVNGADKLAAPWYGDLSIEVLNVLFALLNDEVSQEDYREAYRVAVKDVEAAMDRLEDYAVTVGKTDENPDVPVWWNLAKAMLICSYWTPDLDESVKNMKILACYVTHPVVKQLIEGIQWTLEAIRMEDASQYAEYWKQYKEIAMIGYVKDELGDDDFLNYMLEVHDVELE